MPTLIVSTRQRGDDERLTALLGCPAAAVINLGLWHIVYDSGPAAKLFMADGPSRWCIVPSRHGVPFLAALPAAERCKLNVICLGPGTKRQLQSAGIETILTPATGHDSEALLAMDEMQHVAGAKITVLTAPGGRDLIASTLRQRGAEVRVLYVYRRAPSTPDAAAIARLTAHRDNFITLATSASGLHALHQALPTAVWQRLFFYPVIVISKRLAALATDFGFARIVSSPDPSTESLAACCRLLLQNNFRRTTI